MTNSHEQEQHAAAVDAPKAPPVSGGSIWNGAFDAFGQAYNQVMKNPQPLLLLLAVYAVLACIDMLVSGEKLATSSTFSISDATFLIFLLAMPTYALAIADKKVISIKQFMQFEAHRYFIMLGTLILTYLIIGFSLVLLLVPAIWTIAWFSLSMYPVLDKKMGVIESLKESKRLAENHKAKVWGLIGATLLLMIPLALLSFVPIIGQVYAAFISVLMGGAEAILYRWLQHNATDAA